MESLLYCVAQLLNRRALSTVLTTELYGVLRSSEMWRLVKPLCRAGCTLEMIRRHSYICKLPIPKIVKTTGLAGWDFLSVPGLAHCLSQPTLCIETYFHASLWSYGHVFCEFFGSEVAIFLLVFSTANTSPKNAQVTKLSQRAAKLNLQPGDKMLDIGCGLGSPATLTIQC